MCGGEEVSMEKGWVEGKRIAHGVCVWGGVYCALRQRGLGVVCWGGLGVCLKKRFRVVGGKHVGVGWGDGQVCEVVVRELERGGRGWIG